MNGTFDLGVLNCRTELISRYCFKLFYAQCSLTQFIWSVCTWIFSRKRGCVYYACKQVKSSQIKPSHFSMCKFYVCMLDCVELRFELKSICVIICYFGTHFLIAHFINWYAFIIQNVRMNERERECVCADHKHVKNTFNAPSLTCRNSLRIWTKIITVITTIKTRSDQTKRLQYPKIKHTSQLQHHWTLWNLSCMNGKKQTKKEERNKSFTNNRNSIYARNAIHSYT